ncbi:MAG TPA: divalent-cation tolerance protein CutA [Streptosporangiaceae bacterium]|jgi:periplasmic divalent cation tolerance protein|nr:divalent-cation tolerance protein CutA [Streptosporangiaceae bacterium]
MDGTHVQVTTATDSRAEAAELAKSAVRERLAAGAQLVGPVASTYWWEGEIESAEEWIVVFKTTVERFDELAELIADQHSYDTPEIIAVPVVAGSADYLAWVSEQIEDAGDAGEGDD